MADVVRSYEIRISAVLDRSTAAAAGDFVQQFERAHRRTARSQVDESQRAQRYVQGIRDRYFADQQRAEESAQKAAGRTQEQGQKYAARIRDRYFMDQQRTEERKEREAVRSIERKEREAVRSAERVAKKEEQISKQALEERRAQVRQIAGDTMSNMASIATKAIGVYGGIAKAAGVNFDLGSGVGKAVQLQRMAVSIVNNAQEVPGETEAMRNQRVNSLQTKAREIGNTYAVDPSKVLGGMAQFQAKTGDMATAEAGLDRFAKLAKAFNVELDDMISAAGEVSSKLEDSFTPGEKRAAKTYDVLKKLTAQGQEGAIEIADLAKEAARIGGGAGFFKGDIGDTIAKLSALAQLARQTGGANSPADAARAAAAFVTTMKTPARRAAFDRYKVKYQSEDGSFLDPNVVIKNALLATQGDPRKQIEKMNEMFKSSIGTKPVDALAKEFRGAGGGEAGIAAVDKLLARFSKPLSDNQIDERSRRAVGSNESSVQLFQNKIDAIAATMADRLLPQLNRLAPTVLKLADAMSQMLVFAAENPGRAITLAIVGSIGKASLGPMIAKSLTESIAGRMGGGPGTPGFQGLDASRKGAFGLQAGTTGSLFGSGLAIGSIAVTTFTVGSMIVDKMVEAASAADTGHINDDLRLDETKTILKGMQKTGQISEADQTKVRENIASLEERINIAKDRAAPFATNTYAQATANYLKGSGPSLEKLERGDKDKADLSGLEAELAAQKAELAKMSNGIINGVIKVTGKVEISNMPAAPGAGRDGTPDH